MVFVPGHFAALVGLSTAMRVPGPSLNFFTQGNLLCSWAAGLARCPYQLGHSISGSATWHEMVLCSCYTCTSEIFLPQLCWLPIAKAAFLRLYIKVS